MKRERKKQGAKKWLRLVVVNQQSVCLFGSHCEMYECITVRLSRKGAQTEPQNRKPKKVMTWPWFSSSSSSLLSIPRCLQHRILHIPSAITSPTIYVSHFPSDQILGFLLISCNLQILLHSGYYINTSRIFHVFLLENSPFIVNFSFFNLYLWWSYL